MMEDYKPSEDKDMDSKIMKLVEVLLEWGVETYESCQGGEGHPVDEPMVRFHGGRFEGVHAYRVAMLNGFNVKKINRFWNVIEEEIDGPSWELVLWNTGRKNMEFLPIINRKR